MLIGRIKKIFLILTLILVIFFGYEIGNRPFADPDEGRYVEIPREMVVTGDYVTPRLNGARYFEKPIMGYWLIAGAMRVFGENAFAGRFARLSSFFSATTFLVSLGAYSLAIFSA